MDLKDELVSISYEGSTHTRKASEWLALARTDLRAEGEPVAWICTMTATGDAQLTADSTLAAFRRQQGNVWNIVPLFARPAPSGMEWIPVSEPPTKRGQYLAAFKDGCVAEDEYYGPEHKQWWRETHADHGKVTHWMPLPAAPVAGALK